MLLTSFLAASLALVVAQEPSTPVSSSSNSAIASSNTTPLSASNVASGGDYVTGTFVSYTSTISLGGTSNTYTSTTPSTTGTVNGTNMTNSTMTGSVSSSSSRTLLVGTSQTSTRTATSASASAVSSGNTTPCNGYASFCNRKYSNISMVAAHNSPFRVRDNVASNQMLDVNTQLNDGIRMLQFQVHKPNGSSPLLLCHTSCNLLNAGTLVAYLTTVRQWLDRNPYDVITILMGNYDVLSPQNFVAPVMDSGLLKYAYTPPTVPMPLASWPTLGEMIISGKRVVIMLDYEADQTAIPWLLDEFGQMWETPFSPTNRDFPCTVDRPPNQNRNESMDRMYMANHNLNVELSLGTFNLLIPAFPLLNETNAVTGYGSAGAQMNSCTSDWGRPPNFLLVDYYNLGNFNGSVFQVAANANGVSYTRDSCCGLGQRVISEASSAAGSSAGGLVSLVGITLWLLYT